MKTFDNLPEGTVITNPIDGDMTVCYSDVFSEDDTKQLCLTGGRCIWPSSEFDPRDWEAKKGV